MLLWLVRLSPSPFLTRYTSKGDSRSMGLCGRGVFTRSYLSPEGRQVLVAVDFESREVGTVVVEAGDNPLTIAAELWDLLDLQDPDHARRVGPRDPSRKQTGGNAAQIVAALPIATTLALAKVWLTIGHHFARHFG